MKFLFLFFTLINFAKAEEQLKIVAKGLVPIELKILFDSYQNQNFDIKNHQELLKHATLLDTFAKKISKEDFHFVIKTEFYKAFLRLNSNNKEVANLNDLEKINSIIPLTKDPLIKWILLTSKTDLTNIFESVEYKKMNSKLEDGNQKIDSKRILKKLQLISRLTSTIDYENPDNSRFTYYPFVLEILKNIEEALFLVSNELSDENKVKISTELVNFSVEKIQISATPLPVEKSVEDILDDKITEPSPTKLPTPSNENWLLEELENKSIKNLPKPSNDADWLQDI